MNKQKINPKILILGFYYYIYLKFINKNHKIKTILIINDIDKNLIKILIYNYKLYINIKIINKEVINYSFVILIFNL